jgi:RNA polymerase sigma-70 factor, ECF subfamily
MSNTQPNPCPDPSALLRRMLEQHGRSVCGYLRLLGIPDRDLDDALQEVFFVVCRRVHDYEERGRSRAWLYSICRLVAKRSQRVRRRSEDLVEDPELEVDATQFEQAVDHQALALGRRLLQALKPTQREVFWLYEVEELSMAEIARVLGCPLQTAYSRLQAARTRLLALREMLPNDAPRPLAAPASPKAPRREPLTIASFKRWAPAY